ncbi:MAG: NAD(P)-dependent oxidoreductase [Candidatus Hydrogenedentota bacterium]
MSVVVFGAGGQLGRDLLRVFSRTEDVFPYDHHDVDITNRDAVMKCMQSVNPAWVINAAAYTDVEKSEDDRDAAFRVNETGARVVAQCAHVQNVPVVYFSTDFVFDGTAYTPYEPEDAIEPRGAYAQSKAAGEAAVRSVSPRHYIVRTAWLYGPGGNNFVEKILNAASVRPSLRVVTDEIGSPTHTLDLARATAALVCTGQYGTYHAVNEGSCSRFAFAESIVREAGLATQIEPCLASDYPSKAPRPSYSVMSNAKLKAACGIEMPQWQTALAEYMKRREIQE